MQQQPPYPPDDRFGPGPVRPVADQGSRVKVWGVVAAAVSAAAGVATAIAAFMGNAGSTDPAKVTAVPTGSEAGATSATAMPAPSPAGSAAVRWTGKVVLGLEGIDLSKVPPAKGSELFTRPAAGRQGSNGMEVKGTAALWEGPGEPTAQGCRDLLLTQSHDRVDVVEGDRVCVVNETSPIALLKITATHYMKGSYGELDAELTVWDLRLKR